MSSQTCMRPALPPAEVEGLILPLSLLDPLERCEEHEESLSMFCLDDLEPLCEQCAAASHAGHRVYLLTEAAVDCKAELRTSLKGLNMKMIHYRKISHTCEDTSKYNQVEARLAEEYMKQEFETLRQFLKQEETFRLLAVKEERDEKMRRAKERGDEINQVIKSLEEKIQLAEEEIDAGGDGAEFLQSYEDTMDSSRAGDWKPKSLCRALLNVSKHLGNLRYAVWEKMKHIAPFTPVTLDSRTAGQSLRVSSGLSSFHVEGPVPAPGTAEAVAAPANPERFLNSCILAREGFISGLHCWDVEVGDVNNWTLGVAAQWVSRQTQSETSPEAGLWCLSLRDGEYRALTTQSQVLQVDDSHHLHKVRVTLDWEGGTLEFGNADTDEHLFTFRHCFREKVYPYFESVSPQGNLAVMAQSVTVSVGADCVSDEDPVVITNNQGINSESRNCTTANRHSTEEKKSPKCDVKEEKTAKPKLKKKKASNNKTAVKQKTSRRCNVTYHVSLNKALKKQHQQ